MSCEHGHHHHDHHGLIAGGKMGWAVLLTVAFVVGEGLAGLLGHSVALLSDAGHNLADALALLFSWYALRVASRPSSATRTFGYHRVGILAALVNAASLVVISVFIAWEAVQRLLHPQPVHGGVMIIVAGTAVAINVLIAFWLQRHAEHDLNVRSAYLHMLGDAASAAAVIVAGIIVLATGNTIADPIVSFIIAALILWSSWGILHESVNVLLEATPAGMDMCAVEQTIAKVDGVLDVHDLHVWTVGPGVVACSCHVTVAEQTISSGQQVLRGVVAELHKGFNINHTTVQVEVEGCEPNHMYCQIQRSEGVHAGHSH
ncbi:MAG TPA: cation diffusion facilitator family transporter [Tepidisphaeraceae bacterium]|jgi:cobalt-zinc-cadmium efflux system protein